MGEISGRTKYTALSVVVDGFVTLRAHRQAGFLAAKALMKEGG